MVYLPCNTAVSSKNRPLCNTRNVSNFSTSSPFHSIGQFWKTYSFTCCIVFSGVNWNSAFFPDTRRSRKCILSGCGIAGVVSVGDVSGEGEVGGEGDDIDDVSVSSDDEPESMN